MSAMIDHDAEQTCLGAVLRDNAALNELEGLVRPEHFHDPAHRQVYAAMLAMRSAGRQIDAMTLRDELGEQLLALGGVAFVVGLEDGLPRVTNAAEWGRIVVQKARRRALVGLAEKFLQRAQDDTLSVEQCVEDHTAEVSRLIAETERGVRHVSEVQRGAQVALEQYAESKDGLIGLPTGLSRLDWMTCGMRRGELWIVGARPSRGKSALCAQIATHAASKGAKTLVFTMEMTPEQITQRMALSEACVDKHDLRRPGRVQEDAFQHLAVQWSRFEDLPLWFDGRESPSLAQIRAACRQQAQRGGLDLIVIDYLQRCSVDARQDRWVAVGDLAKGLKNLALSLKVPVLAACQTNADTEEKRPTLADLAQARQVISAEADVVSFLHPKDLASWRNQECREPVIQLLVEKNRNGQTGPVDLSFLRSYVRFVESQQ